jgi:hypothetical protein
MFWPGIKGRFVNVKQFYGNVFPNYFEFIYNAGLPQDGFIPGDAGPKEEYRFDWVKRYSSYDKETKQELAIIQKRIDGHMHQYVIKNSALQEVIVESIYRYNNIWEALNEL